MQRGIINFVWIASVFAKNLLGATAGRRHSSAETSHRSLSSNSAGIQDVDPQFFIDKEPPPGPRLIACTLLKDELPLLVEWIEFHRMMGFAHLAVYDDGSTDGAHLVEQFYGQHGLDYVTFVPNTYNGSRIERRIEAAGQCFKRFRHLADWIIHMDVDEYIWSPQHETLQSYFETEVSDETHILYTGATRFGWGGQRHRYTYTLQQIPSLWKCSPLMPPPSMYPDALMNAVADMPRQLWQDDGAGEQGAGTSIQLLNPAGLQLVTQTHLKRAADRRFGEPEDLIAESLDYCRSQRTTSTTLSPCTNDGDMRHGKTWIRASTGEGLWTHGGSVKADRGSGEEWFQIGDGLQMHTSECPSPVCERADPWRLHIYHYRSSSMEDELKKSTDWALEANEDFVAWLTDEQYTESTGFLNAVRDVSMTKFGTRLQHRMAALLSPDLSGA